MSLPSCAGCDRKLWPGELDDDDLTHRIDSDVFHVQCCPDPECVEWRERVRADLVEADRRAFYKDR